MTTLITPFGHVKEIVGYGRDTRDGHYLTAVLTNGDVIDIPTDETVVAQAVAVSA